MSLRKNLRLASFDGGGVRGFSQLEIMRSIIYSLNWNKNSSGFEESEHPWQHFDLIGGSGTGGLIAIMLARLRMSVEEASEEFFTITEEVYKNDALDSPERSRRLRQCMEDLLQRRELPLDAKLLEEAPDDCCVGFVLASLRNSLETKVCFRTYSVRSQPSSPITILDAVLATCAVQPAFASVSFGERYRRREYVAAGFGANNPIQAVITEAHLLFGGDSHISSLISLGTGHPGIITLPAQTKGADLYTVMRDMMNDCEQKAQDMEQILGSTRIYSRFSVDQGMQNHHHNQATDPEWITTQTESYLTRHDTLEKLEIAVQNISVDEGRITLDQFKNIGGHSVSKMAEVVDKSYDILISNQDDTIIEKLRPLNLQYDSRVSECMEGTRQDIVSEIMDWTADTEAPNILWLKGYPGVGKSAIATTLVEKLRSIGRLGSSFFFKREIADAMTPRALCRKITYDLGRRYPAIRSHLVAALKANDDILSTSNVHHLFCQLIINPLTKSNDIPFKCLPVIIIDALDECRGFDGQRSYHRENLMQMLARWSHLPRRFKLMVTSRGESDICRLFQTTSHYLVEISTGQAVKPQSSSDIMAFLGHEFEKIADEYPNSLPSGWPGLDVIRRLTEMAGGLFVWVEVILKFIKQGDPHQRLGYILQGDVSGDLGTLYSSVLGISFPDPSDEELANFRAIMGTVILMKNPLPVSSLATLLSIQRSTMEYICNRLQSVMDCQDTLRVHHQSFVEFLLDQEACPNAFLIDRAIGHRNLTRACLQTMNSGLKFNTCGLKSSYIPNSEIHNLYSLVSHHISPHLLYSSYFWASHLKEAAFDKVVVSHLHRFMSEMFLFWLEVLSLTRGVNLASTMIRTLINWTRTCGQNIRMACDMERFVAAFANVILQSVPHIYLSALPLSPLTSIVREEYMKKLPRLLTIRHGGHVSWPAIIKVFTGHDDWITSVAFSPDNRLVVSGSWDNTVRIWDAETGELVTQPLEGHKDCVNSVAFSPDGRRVVSGSDDKTIRIWNIETGELIIEPFQGHESGISSVSFSPNGKRIVSGSWDKTVRIWDAEVGEIITRPLVGHKDGVNSVAFSLDGRRVVSGSNDQTVRIWDAETGHLVTKPLQGHKDIVTSVALSPNGRHLVSGSNDKTVQIWDTETGELVTPPLEGHEGGVTCVTFSSDGRRVVSGSNDRTIRIWDAETGQPVTRPLESHSDIVAFVAFSSDGRRIISGSWDKTVQVWNVETDELDTLTSDGHNDGVSSVAFSPDGRRIVSGSWDKTVRIWDTETGALVVEPLEGHRSSVTSVAFSPDGKRVASGSWDKTVRIWDIQMGQLVIQPLNGHKDYVTSVVFSPDSKSVVSGSHDKTIRIWDAETGELITYPLKGHEDYVTSVSFSPNGGRVASGSFDKTIRIWDTETGETVIQPLRGHKLGINLVAFSPDGRRVLSGSRDKTVRLWDAESGGLVAESSQWHECSLISVMFWPSGRCIVSGLNGKTVLIRDAETHEPVAQSLVGHEANVTSLALSPDGRSVVSGSWDNTVRVWDVETDIDILSPNSPVLQIESNLEPNSMQEDGSTPLTTSSAYPHKATVIPSKSVSSIVENFHIEPDGWILGPQSELLLWVPPTLRVGLYRSRNKLIIGRCIKTWIDFDLFVHGNEWARCEEPRDD